MKNPNLSFRLEAFSASDEDEQTSGPTNMLEASPRQTNAGLITLRDATSCSNYYTNSPLTNKNLTTLPGADEDRSFPD